MYEINYEINLSTSGLKFMLCFLKVLVKNEICGLNYLDVLVRNGALPLKAVGSGFPLIMGVEAAGTVEKIGVNVTSVTKGERVAYAVVGSGK